MDRAGDRDRERASLARSLSLPGRRKKSRNEGDDRDAGFSLPKRERNYDHDMGGIKLSISVIKKAGKKLSGLQAAIIRKREKPSSKELDKRKEDYDEWMSELAKELKRLSDIVCEEQTVDRVERSPQRCNECFHRDKDMLRLQAECESLKQQVREERRAKEEALTRLSAMASSRLKDNNPNLTDLSDPNRPSKIGDMFSELYDNEWTNAYDDLKSNLTDVEIVQHLNILVMTAYDCCMKLFKPCQLYLDNKITKIDSEFRQKIIGHFKHSAMAIIPRLCKDLEEDVCTTVNVTYKPNSLSCYIKKSIEICWLMTIQDPPMLLYNTIPEKYDTTKYRYYQNNGPYTEHVVWPALILCQGGQLLAKGVAEGTNVPSKRPKQTGRSMGKNEPMNQTWHPSNRGTRSRYSTTTRQGSQNTDL